MLKVLRIVFLILMLLFMSVQLNDPDGGAWLLLYGLPAGLLAVSIARPCWWQCVAGRWVWSLALCVLVAAAYVHWPPGSGWWRQAIWWESEAAREGMGLMIACGFAACSYVGRPHKAVS